MATAVVGSRPAATVQRPEWTTADRAWTVAVVVAVNAALTVGVWLRHGGIDAMAAPGGTFTAAGQLAGLVGTYAVLIELLLMSRIGWLEQHVGFDRLAVWHRWNGFAAVWLLTAHAAFITLGYAAADGQSIVGQTRDFLIHYPDMLMAVVGLGAFVAVGVSSARAARRRVSRETWYSVHLYAYLAVALSFGHQLASGADFATDPIARAWWVALYVAVFGAILAWRVGRPLLFNVRHRLRVEAVRPEADGVVSVYLTGRRLDQVRAAPGQFFLWRFLSGTGWAKAHPYSLSAAPNDRFLRITVKELGDDSRRVLGLGPRTRAFAEGPYGTFTGRQRTRRRVVLIAGGIGITPIRALIETLPGGPGDITVLYRAATEHDVAFADELLALAARRAIDLRLLIGTEIGDDRTDRLGIPALRALVPDIAECDVFLCGPPTMVDAVRRRLARLRVPRRHVHFERFAY